MPITVELEVVIFSWFSGEIIEDMPPTCKLGIKNALFKDEEATSEG